MSDQEEEAYDFTDIQIKEESMSEEDAIDSSFLDFLDEFLSVDGGLEATEMADMPLVEIMRLAYLGGFQSGMEKANEDIMMDIENMEIEDDKENSS